MPIYEYRCTEEHVTEHLRKYADRDNPFRCHLCGSAVERIEISMPHCVPDGMYSYSPNLGSARDFERRQNALETGQRVVKRTFDDS